VPSRFRPSPRVLAVLLLALGVVSPSARARLLVVTRLTRSPGTLALGARGVLTQPALRRAVSVWLAHPGARLVLAPPAGVYGRVWAADLRSWLVALGIPLGRIAIRPGVARGTSLRIEVRDASG
jgi:hypothetical protein